MALGWDTLAKPFRGIGQIATGHVKKGLNTIGSAASEAAPVVAWVPGFGPVAAGVMGAGGELLKEATDNKPGIQPWDVLQSGLRGGASGAAAGLAGGVSGAVDKAIGAGDWAMHGIGNLASKAGGVVGIGGGGAPAATDAVTTAAGAVVPVATTGAPATAGGLGTLGKIALGLQGLGTAANAYGAYKTGAAQDRAAQLQEDQIRRADTRQEAMDPYRAELFRMLMEKLKGNNATANA